MSSSLGDFVSLNPSTGFFPESHWSKLPDHFTAMQNSKISPKAIPWTAVSREKKIVFVLKKCIKTTAIQNSKNFPGQCPGPRLKGYEILFPFSENVSYSNANFKKIPGDNTMDPVLGARKVFFRSPKIYQNSPTAMQNSKIFPGTIPWTFVLGAGYFVFILRKFTKTPIQPCKIHKFSGDNTPNPRFREEDSLFSFSKNVPKLSYSNVEFRTNPG